MCTQVQKKWIVANDQEPLKKAIAEYQKWWTDIQARQKALAKTAEPILSAASLEEAWKKVNDVYNALSKTKKPKASKTDSSESKAEPKADPKAKTEL